MISAAIALPILNIVLGASLFGWATHDALVSKTMVGRVCNGLLAVQGILCFVAALVSLASLPPA